MPIRSRLLMCAMLAFAAPIVPARAAPEPAPKRVEIAARVIVKNADGAPIAGADIALWTPDATGKFDWHDAQTDAQGSFDVKAFFAAPNAKEVEEETARGLIHAAGYALQEFFIAPDGRVYARAGGEKQTSSSIELSSATATVKGIVTDEKGAPAAGIAVDLSYLENAGAAGGYSFIGVGGLPETLAIARVLRARTDKNGAWQLSDLPAGFTASLTIEDPRFQHEAILSVLGGGKISPPVKTALKVGARIRGRVVFPDGKPVPNAEVSVSVSVKVSSVESATYAVNGTSNADGNYEIFGLPPGAAKISVAPPAGEWAPSGLSGVALKAGVQTSAPDVKLTHGVLLAGTVTQQGSKTPIAGAQAMADGPFGLAQSTPTDARGRYTIHAAFGQTRLYLFSIPDDYLRNWGDEHNISIAATTKSAPNFTLRRGITLRGTALDEDKKPATGASISTGEGSGGQFTRVDETGKWTLKGVDPREAQPGQTPDQEDGKITLRTDGEWGIVGDARAFANTTEPIPLTMRRLDLQDVAVRVLTAEGKPLAGAEVAVAIQDAKGSTFRRTILSDEKGVVTVPKMRPDYSAELTPKVAGYGVKTAGVIVASKDAKNKTRASDAVMVALNRSIAGRVVDAQGAPVADARVALLSQVDARDLTDFAHTDAAGNWRFEDLAPGEISVGAARGREWGMATAAPTAGNIEIRLAAPRQQPRPQDKIRARELLSGWLADAGKNPSFDLLRLAVDFAALEPQSAPTFGALMSENSRTEFERNLARLRAAQDPQSAIADARNRAKDEENIEDRRGAQLELIGLLIPTDKAQAARIYSEFAPTEPPKDADELATATYRDATLLGLASALEQPNAADWRAAFARDLAAHAPDELTLRIGVYMEAIAGNDMAGALDFLKTLPPEQQVRAMEDIIPLVAKRDLPRAQTLLGAMEKLVALPDLPVEAPRDDAMYRPTPTDSLNAARGAVVRQLLSTNPQAAYDLARQMSAPDEFNDYALEASLRLPPVQTLAVLREAFEGAQKSDVDDMARIAALVAPLDADLSEQWFAIARARLTRQFDVPNQYRQGAAPYAFYRATSDAAQSRLLLENEWTRVRGQNLDNGIRPAFDAVWAMAPLDFERALVMLGQAQARLSADNESMEETDVKRSLILWLLSSDAERRQLRFRYPTGAALPEGER